MRYNYLLQISRRCSEDGDFMLLNTLIIGDHFVTLVDIGSQYNNASADDINRSDGDPSNDEIVELHHFTIIGASSGYLKMKRVTHRTRFADGR